MEAGLHMKRCGKCGEERPLDHFAKRPDRPDGRGTLCRECKAAYDRAYLRDNRERIREKNRRWWAKATEKAEGIRERRKPKLRAYYHANRDRMREANRVYHAEHPEEMRARHRRWYAENPEKGRELSHRRKALKRSAIATHGGHTEQEWLDLLARCGGQCAQCGATERITKDHIVPLSLGGNDRIENIQPLCLPCNVRKSNSLGPLSEHAG